VRLDFVAHREGVAHCSLRPDINVPLQRATYTVPKKQPQPQKPQYREINGIKNNIVFVIKD
jgi:histidyl-tRNA synthetase